MKSQKIIKFFRFTFQGVAIASLGTLGITPTWGSSIMGLSTLLLSFVCLAYEEGDD